MSTPPEIWWPAPGLGEIVWCWWPIQSASIPGPKPRPCLVLDLNEQIQGKPRVRVAYGTSQNVTQLHSGEFAIIKASNPQAYALAGLSYDTKFDLKQKVWLPYSTRAFDVPPGAPHGQIPKLGLLHPSLYRAAATAHAASGGP